MSRVCDFGLGGQFPDSSTKILLSPKKGSNPTLIGRGHSRAPTYWERAMLRSTHPYRILAG